MDAALTVEQQHVVFSDKSLELFEVDERWCNLVDEVMQFALQGIHESLLTDLMEPHDGRILAGVPESF